MAVFCLRQLVKLKKQRFFIVRRDPDYFFEEDKRGPIQDMVGFKKLKSKMEYSGQKPRKMALFGLIQTFMYGIIK